MKIFDTHMHLVPAVDDGAKDLQMSLEMIKMSVQQGVSGIFCTSHNSYYSLYRKEYNEGFKALKECVSAEFPDVSLFTGCEILCFPGELKQILAGLENGLFIPMGNSKCVLTEFFPGTDSKETNTVADALLAEGWTPVIAHTERYPLLFRDDTVERLVEKGCYIQVNLYSLSDETDYGIRTNARELLDKHLIHVVGTDAHRTTHRPPCVKNGVDHILRNTDKKYASDILSENARKLFGIT